ncbi:hypothetical protein AGABI2DRAFT_192229 [Agaricus bisporus var. bisporus H97]|uniref:hypothetical protein n=1 Tax=Agaricus bisporus var. bisporus (strain H97 / ATCC MYA-4626 / FGSC 10389) TaxID=936046 RepID=UPI00029F5542|nr:hypothetical protein AGABI2DRAFT_192229 [Agaricus bisporus var. bisporus H97]EKV48701.1 hypothetical protein AGABI2DRAFT_192229 [Agaricus bisporus var. bisporus H97]
MLKGSQEPLAQLNYLTMFVKAYLVASTLIAVAAAQVNPTCFQGTPTSAGPATDCTPFVDDFCDSVGLLRIRVNDSITRCYELPNENVCDFGVHNTMVLDNPPSIVNCKAILTSAISQCNLGGFGKIAPVAYTFTVDVNRAQCGTLHVGN